MSPYPPLVTTLTAITGALWLAYHYVPPMERLRAADAILVLGHPANSDGTASRAMREEVGLAAQLYHAGLASQVILSGGAIHNQHPEGLVMAALADELGIPSGAIHLDLEARDTVENILNCRNLMGRQGWRDLIVVTTPFHARRASIILRLHDLAFQIAYPSASYQLDSLARRLWALRYEVLGLAWLAVAHPLNLRPFWLRRQDRSA